VNHQAISIIFAFRIYKFNRLSKWWLALILAFLIQGIRRLITLYDDINLISITNNLLIDRSLMFIISILILIGLWAMMKNFENFDIIEKKVEKKLIR
jgi:hypothetical protein